MTATNAAISATPEEAPTNGLLCGTYKAVPAPIGSYVLQKQNDIYGFYHVEDEITVGAFRAYLDAPASSVKAFHLGDGATSIQEIVNSKSSNGKWFNLAGQRVQEIQKGVNITNGKKVILK